MKTNAERQEAWRERWRLRAALLEAQVDFLRAALRPFAETPIPPGAKPHYAINYRPVTATYRDVQAARDTLRHTAPDAHKKSPPAEAEG